MSEPHVPNDSATSRRNFLRTAGTLAATAAASGTLGAAACAPIDRAPGNPASAAGGAARAHGFDRTQLNALGEVLLPGALGADGRAAAIAAFVEWVDGYEPVAEEMHGYGYADVRYLPADPAPAWRAQLTALDLLAQRTRGKEFAALDVPAREAIVTMALRDVRGDRLPPPLEASHIALALLAHWASSPDAWNRALGVEVSPGTCRPLADATRAPLPMAAGAKP